MPEVTTAVLEKGIKGSSLSNLEAGSEGRAAIDSLAHRLYWKMEHLEPTGGTWDALPEDGREFYRACVLALQQEPDALQALLRRALSSHDKLIGF